MARTRGNQGFLSSSRCREIVDVDDEIVYRWESLRYKFVLLDESRAELDQFPDVVRRIVTLHKARKTHPNRNMRKALDVRIEQAMREALKPIEAELDALYDFTEMVTDLEKKAAKELSRPTHILHKRNSNPPPRSTYSTRKRVKQLLGL
jgi:hypothetical protein